MNLREPRVLKTLARAILATFETVKSIQQELRKMTAQSDALAAAVTDMSDKVQALNDTVVTHDNAVKAELVALAAAVAASSAAADPAIQASIDKLATLSTSVAATSATVAQETTALVASLPPAATADPAPAPAPVPNPAPDA
jgi:ABC-type transporter Mla subunit MlaD